MTKAEFRETVLSIARAFGRGVPSDPATVDGLIVERLRKFTEETRCLYTMDCIVTLTQGVAEYPLEGSGFSIPMVDIDQLYIDSAALQRSEPSDFAAQYAGALTQSGPPAGWTMMPGKIVRFAPTPDDAYTGRAIGPRTHRNLTAGPEGDDEQIEIPAASIRTAAAFCAVPLAFPHAVGREDMELLALVDKASVQDMHTLRAESISLRHGRMVRGAKKRFGSIDLS